MKTNAILSVSLAAFLGLGAILPAAAATTTSTTTSNTTAPQASASAKATAKAQHYYVSLKAKGPGCEVVEVKPSTKLMVGKHVYKTEADADKALKGAKACRA